ncbi:sporulation protein [Brevibacillus sp. SYSU BS000544]|uniref:sporulation protein n=1 Tax=Brevibacillus sp. SYSU BS000544 TaxID=3416443 RepID=UPI003CE4D476
MRITLLVISLFLVISGCTQQSNPQTKTKSAAEDPLCNPVPIRKLDSEQKGKAIAQLVNGVDKAVAVHIDDELDVAIEVTNFNRLRLESIEKEVAQNLKAEFPKIKIHVSSDKKILNELQKLSDMPYASEQKGACDQKKKLKQIEKQMKG